MKGLTTATSSIGTVGSKDPRIYLNNNLSALNCFNYDLKFYNIYEVTVKDELKE